MTLNTPRNKDFSSLRANGISFGEMSDVREKRRSREERRVP